MILLALFSTAVAFAVSLVFIRNARGHARRYGDSMVQRFHKGDVPRIGGVAILLGLACGWSTAALSAAGGDRVNTSISLAAAATWLLVVMPAAVAGAWEDVTQKVSVALRFGMTSVSAALACWLLDLNVGRLGLPYVDGWLAALPAAGALLAFLALCGLPHAFNLIDGYNGLAGTVALIIGLALVHVALANGDRQLAGLIICLVGATAGFLMWNYPRGLIFAGDGGAYLWGLVIGIASIVMVQRHPLVSPWFPVLLVIYPVSETLFSIYRKAARGGSPGVADALHFHQLIYRRIVRDVFERDEARRILSRNNRTSPYLWGFAALSIVPALLFWSNTPVLIFFSLVSATAYVSAYLMIIRFKVPPWLARTRRAARRHGREHARLVRHHPHIESPARSASAEHARATVSSEAEEP